MDEPESPAALLASIAAELAVVMGRPEKVRSDCARLRAQVGRPPSPADRDVLLELGRLLGGRSDALGLPVCELLEDLAAASDDPWPLLESLLASRDAGRVGRALLLCERLAAAGSLSLGPRALGFLAEHAGQPGSPLAAPEALASIAAILRQPAREGQDPVLTLYRETTGREIRRLAARVLDLDQQPPPAELAERVLGLEAHGFLDRYLRYTRATHLDLLDLAEPAGVPALASLRRAEALCGEEQLRAVIAELGWSRLNLGLEVRPCVGISVGGSVPLFVAAAEAPLLEACPGARRVDELRLFLAHGGLPAASAGSGADRVSRFRAYNLAHAEALADILDVAPLTREKVQRIVERMDRIVGDFVAIFASHAEECAILPELYRGLRARVVSELEGEGAPEQLSAELTRLVQSFEDPRTLGEVRTLHGLKRHLHQRGLQLGFRLVEARGATNRTLDLLLASGTRVVRSLRRIAYVDFEPESALAVPYGVALLAEGFARQLLHGQEGFPSAQVFCYGNEVHYYLAFRNHPAFLRIDYSPPLAGGMIDLEYYGVSVYELSAHPNPTLDALQLFFRRLEFFVKLEGTRVHARYDKERALDLGDVCDKAELLLCLVPYLMDLDWVVGSLRYAAPGRRRVAEAWAESFAEWGVLPLRQLLSRDRQSVLLGVAGGPAGPREITWSGEPPYRDRLRVAAPELLVGLRRALAELGLEGATAPAADATPAWLVGQVRLERQFLRPLREAVARGQLAAAGGALSPRGPGLFERRHEAEVLAELLAGGEIAGAVRLAQIVAPLERTLRFRATGRVNGHELQRARLALRGQQLVLYGLRDPGGIIRLAVFGQGDVLGRWRDDPSEPWQETWSADPARLTALLRRDGYLPAGVEAGVAPEAETAATLALLRRPGPARGSPPLPGERVLEGFRASPGRTVGRALLGTTGRVPADLDGAVLVAPSVGPEDNTFLYHARGIVSTGGGILSHAGLIATQFRKPALIVPGRWLREPDGAPALLYRTPEYRVEQASVAGCPVAMYRDWREREHRLREGDLVVLDAVAGTLRVLGQERDALALHEELWRFGEAGRRLLGGCEAPELLALRGQRVRAAHLVRKLLGRLTDPVLARHAAHELLAGEALAAEAASPDERAQLLGALLGNPVVGEAARGSLLELSGELQERHAAAVDEARREIPRAGSAYELLAERLEALRLGRSLESVRSSLRACGMAVPPPREPPAAAQLDGLALTRLAELYAARRRELAESSAGDPRRRHLLRQLERLARLLGEPEDAALCEARARLALDDEAARDRLRGQLVVAAGDAGFALHALVGWKAANLAEVARLGGGVVPPWFVVSDHAFEQVFDAPLAWLAPGLGDVPPGATSLRTAVAAILARSDLDDARKSARIRSLWAAVRLPEPLSQAVLLAYRRLAQPPAATGDADDPVGPFVAIRSSAREEDAEVAARAGEFETFLFVRGEEQVLEHLKRAWSGLWTERAIHNRALLEPGSGREGGGVVFQRIVWSRVSGVLQTVNVAEGDPREMVVNVGLGLGEGIVSGSVAADHVVIAKQGDLERGPLRFRYVTADKREQVGFDRRAGLGTTRTECLYHQRLRPALEYVELCELVRLAARLEAAYGYPLDIEFGIEGSRLFVLQARPVATFLALLRETLEREPLAVAPVPVTAGGVSP